MANRDEISKLIADSNVALAETLANALGGMRVQATPTVKLQRFYGMPKRPGDLTLKEWLQDVEVYCRNFGIVGESKANVVIDHLAGPAREEILCCSSEGRKLFDLLVEVLRKRFGPPETVQSLSSTFHAREQLEDETLADYSRGLMRLYYRLETAAKDEEEKSALQTLRENALKEQFVRGAREATTRRELRRMEMAFSGKPFSDMREEALSFFRESESRSRVKSRACGVVGLECSYPSGFDEYRAPVVDRVEQHPNISQIDGIAQNPVMMQMFESFKQMNSRQAQLEENLSQASSQISKLVQLMSGNVKENGVQNSSQNGGQRRFNAENSVRNDSCFYCKEKGHFRNQCPKLAQKKQRDSNVPDSRGGSVEDAPPSKSMQSRSVDFVSLCNATRSEVTFENVPASHVDVSTCNDANSCGILSKMMSSSPLVEIEIAGIMLSCVLDTGAETSLIPASIYHEFLEGKVGDLSNVSGYIRIVGANDLDIPIEGYLQVPVRVFGETILESGFLVRKDVVRNDAIGGRRKDPRVIVGCNILKPLMTRAVDPVGPNRDEWLFTLRCLSLADQSMPPRSVGNETPIHLLQTRNKPIVIGAKEVQVVPCCLDIGFGDLKGRCVALEGQSIRSYGMDSGQLLVSDGQSGPIGCVAYDGCQVVDGNSMDILVANLSRESVIIPPFTRVCKAIEVDDVSQVTESYSPNGTELVVREVLAECGLSVAFDELSSDHLEEGDQSPVIANSPKLFTFPDGSVYELPPGIDLEGLSESDAILAAEMIRRQDAAFSRSAYDLGSCNLIPHKIILNDDRPVSLPYRRIPPNLIDEVRQEIQSMLDKGIIQKSSSPYASCVVLVRKRDGSLRVVIDYRRLNVKTVRDAFPLPRIEETLEALEGAALFSSLDLKHDVEEELSSDSEEIGLEVLFDAETEIVPAVTAPAVTADTGRHSVRPNRGIHPNPYNLPRSVLSDM